MSTRKALGVSLGFAGALVLIGPGVLQIASDRLEALGQLACVGAALCYAVASILTRRCPPVDAIGLSAVSLCVGAALLVPITLVVEGPPRLSGGLPDAAIVFLGLIPTAFATLVRVRVVQTAGSVFMTLVNYQVPVWSMVLGAAVLGEVLPLSFFAALARILLGLGISQWSSLRQLATTGRRARR